MRKKLTQLLSVVLAAAMLLSFCPTEALAADAGPAAALCPFADSGVSAETRAKEMFYFGSTNLTVSEKSKEDRLLKICRGGSAESEAAVTVKFGDYSAVYGENYTVSLYEGDGELTLNPDRFSVVRFLLENADSRTELTAEEAAEEERALLERFVSQKNADLYDVNGRLISTLRLTEDGEEGEERSASVGAEDQAGSDDFDSNLSDYSAAVQVRLTFAPGETEKYIVITPVYSPEAQGDAQVEITLDNPSEGMFLPDEDYITVLTIEDEDEVRPAVLSLTETELSADGGSVTFTVTREGAINNLVGARVTAEELDAVMGDDFQGVDAMLYFPMGITERSFTLRLNHRYADRDARFRVKLSGPVGAVLENDSCLVTVLPDENAEAALMDDAVLMGIDGRLNAGMESAPYDFTVHGANAENKAWLTSNTTFWADNRGGDCPYKTWCGVFFYFPKYYYSGMSVNWSVGRRKPTYGKSDIRYYEGNGVGHDIFSKDTGSFSDDWDSGLFCCPDAYCGYVGIKTTSCYGKYLTVHQVRMTRMKYVVNLVEADPLSYLGVPAPEEAEYVSVSISGCAPETRKKDVYTGDSITITMPNTGRDFALLSDLLLVDEKGNQLFRIRDIDPEALVFQNGTAVTLTLTEKLITSVGAKLQSLGYYKAENGLWEGKLYVKPVFSYQDAVVRLSSLEEGEASFESFRDVSLNLHIGDRITVSEQAVSSSRDEENFVLATVVENPAYHSVGYDAERFKSAELGTVAYLREGGQYANQTCSLQLQSPYTVLSPRVSEKDNTVTVRVEKSLVDGGAFDTAQGLFLYPRTEAGNWYIYTLNDTNQKLSADELYSVSAFAAGPGSVAVWQRGTDGTTYSGNVMYLFTGSRAQDNLLTLSLADGMKNYSVRGTACCAGTVGTAASFGPRLPAMGAALAAGSSTAVSDAETGAFELTDVSAIPGTTVPVLVWFNNSANIIPVRIPMRGDSVNLSAVNLSTNNGDTAYVRNVWFDLGGRPMSDTHGITMNGAKLTMSAEVEDGRAYTVLENGMQVTRIENVTGVSFLVLDGRTYQVKSVHKASKAEDGIWEAVILKFNPEVPDEYDSGDLFYVQITTDRAAAIPGSDAPAETCCAPAATGYGIAAGGSYTPQTISFTAPLSADEVKGSGEAELQGSKGFARLPILGNMDLLSAFAGTLKLGTFGEETERYDLYDYDEMFNESSDPIDEPSSPFAAKLSVKITVRTQTLSDGRLRLHIGVVLSTGNQKAKQLSNPYDNMRSAYDMAAGAKMEQNGFEPAKSHTGIDGRVGIDLFSPSVKQKGANMKDAMKTNLSGLQLSFSMSFGIYLDFVAVAENADFTKIENFCFVGVGGYLGFSGNVSYVAYFVIPVVFLPAYLGFSATAALTGYMGGVKDLSQYLDDSFSADDFLGQEEININNAMEMNVDGAFDLSVTGFAGIGVCNILGLRLNLTLGFNLSYIKRMTEWYPNLDHNWGLSVDLSVGGQVDLLFTSVKLNGLSVPLAYEGFDDYFTALARGEKLLGMVDGYYGEEIPEDELGTLYGSVRADLEDRNATTQQLKADVKALYEYLHDNPGRVGRSASAVYMLYYTDSDIYKLLSDDFGGQEFEVKQPVDSRWLGSMPILQAGYGYSDTLTNVLVSGSYDNPGSQLVSLGNGKMAIFFLADPAALGSPEWCGEHQTTVLAYSVFNGTVWSAPEAVTESPTNDYYPNVVGCGSDRLMVSWVSVPDGDPNGEAKADYTREEAVEVYSAMEIFTAVYDIESGSISGVTQLTDDEFMDICPQGVYDSATGDCAVYYIKTAPDTDVPAEDLSLTDFFSLYTDTVYSMVCYRLYDAEEREWVTSYYDEEIPEGRTQEDYAAEGGQRYLPSVLELMKEQGLADENADAALYRFETWENGDVVTKSAYIDPPIGDLAVCEGYNGLAVYAYTVDMDRDLSTNADTELFIQVYDFLTHRTYRPIRLTDDGYSQARPKLVRSGSSTWLFWLANDSVIQYTDVSELIRDYVDADGNIVTTYYTDSTGRFYYPDDSGIYTLNGSERVYVDEDIRIYRSDADGDYYMDGGRRVSVTDEDMRNEQGEADFEGLSEGSYVFTPSTVSSTVVSGDLKPAVADYQAVMDNDGNIFILWTQLVTDAAETDRHAVPANEVFASAMIRDEDPELTAAWSDPYQLTRSGRQLDGVSGAVSSDGQLFLAYNRFEMTYIGDTEEFLKNAVLNEDGTLSGSPYDIGATDLMVTRLYEIGCMEAETPEISDMTPAAGETVSVSAVIRNAGLTTAKNGYTAEFYELRDGVRGAEPVWQCAEQSAVAAGGSRSVSFDWTVPADPAGVKLVAVVRENGYENENTTESAALRFEPAYTLTVREVVQQGETFLAAYDVTNVGNAASGAGDRVELRFDGMYQSFEKYGLDSDLLKALELEPLQPGETRSFSTEFTVPMQAFDFIGYDQLDVVVLDAEGSLCAADSGDLVLRDPVGMSLNNNEPMGLQPGDTVRPQLSMGNRWVSRLNRISWSVGDESVARVDETGLLTAVGEGETVVTVTALPSGRQVSMPLTVIGASVEDEEPYAPPTEQPGETEQPGDEEQAVMPFADVAEGSWYHDAVLWAVKNGVTTGTDETHFSPDAVCTRAQTVTFLWRAVGCPAPENEDCPFEDVDPKAWYGSAVLWAVETGITNGTDQTHFSPDATVTRAQVVTFLYRFAGMPETDYDAGFTDVKPNEWYSDAVNRAAETGIVVGRGDGSFGTTDTATRAQIVTILCRSFREP